MMMVVVTAFAERDHGEQPVIAAVVSRVISARSESMRERIDGYRRMQQNHRGDKKPPDKHLSAACVERRIFALQPKPEKVQSDSEKNRHQDIETIKPTQFGIASQICNDGPIGAKRLPRQKPSDMASPEPAVRGRVRILLCIGMAVMIAMMRGPPQRPALHATGADQREDELQDARCLERLVRKVTV